MALIDKETIRAEIERKKKDLPDDWLGAIAADWAFTEILAFLDSLPEQPVEGLDSELERYWNWVTGFQPSFAVLELTKEDLAKVARHFAEWGIEEGERQMMENARA